MSTFWLGTFLFCFFSSVWCRVYNVALQTQSDGNSGTDGTIYVAIWGENGWTSHIGFNGDFDDADTFYNLTDFSEWRTLDDVGDPLWVRITFFGGDEFKLGQIWLDGTTVADDFDTLKNSDNDGRCDRLTFKFDEDPVDVVFESISASEGCPVSDNPTVSPTQPTSAPTFSPTSPPTSDNQYETSIDTIIKIEQVEDNNDAKWFNFIQNIESFEYSIEYGLLRDVFNSDGNYTMEDELFILIRQVNDIKRSDLYDSNEVTTTPSPTTETTTEPSDTIDPNTIYVTIKLKVRIFCSNDEVCDAIEAFLSTVQSNSTFYAWLDSELNNEIDTTYVTISIASDDAKSSNGSKGLTTGGLIAIIVVVVVLIIIALCFGLFRWCKYQYGESTENWPCIGNPSNIDSGNKSNSSKKEMVTLNSTPQQYQGQTNVTQQYENEGPGQGPGGPQTNEGNTFAM